MDTVITDKSHARSGQSGMTYKGYLGVVEYDDEAGIFHGEVANLRDVITFQGKCVEDLRQAFRESVDDYLDFCAERGEDPEKPLSGNISLRIGPDLHSRIYLQAKKSHKSVHRWIADTLEQAVE